MTTENSLERYLYVKSPLHEISSVFKVVIFILYIVLSVSMEEYSFIDFFLFLAFLLVMIFISKIPLLFFLKKALFVSLFAVVIAGFMPFFRHGVTDRVVYTLWGNIFIYRDGIVVLGNVLIRANFSILAITLLTGTTGFGKIIRSFSYFGIPPVITVTIGMAYRYIFVLSEEAFTLKRALVSRGFRGKWIWNSRVIGTLVGNLFLRSYERSERIYAALVSRGFSVNNENRIRGRCKCGLTDYLFLSLSLGYLVWIRFGS